MGLCYSLLEGKSTGRLTAGSSCGGGGLGIAGGGYLPPSTAFSQFTTMLIFDWGTGSARAGAGKRTLLLPAWQVCAAMGNLGLRRN